MNLNIYIKDLSAKIDQKSFKERILILITALAAVYFLWQICIFDNISKLTQKLSGSVSKMQNQISTLQGQITEVSSSLTTDPIVKLQQQIKELESTNQDLQNKLNSMTDSLISPKLMTSLLKEILNDVTLNIISLKNIPPVPVVSENNDDKDNEDNVNKFKVYKHGMELMLVGSFFQVVDFLTKLEKLPHKLLLEELEFVSTDYPKAQIKVTVSSLSVHDTLISAF